MSLLNDPYEGFKFENGQVIKVKDTLTTEEALQIKVNGKPFTVIMRSPGLEKEQTIGLLYAERVLNEPSDIELEHTEHSELGYITELNVHIPDKLIGKGLTNTRSMLSVSSCGICGKTELPELNESKNPLDSTHRFKVGILSNLFEKLNQRQATFEKTGGSHAAASFSLKGEMLAFAEDVGRHNAVDKVIGINILNDNLKEARCLLVSGRVSYEIISKAFMARMPILAAVSAPSSLAVDYAKELGITLLGFCRGEKATCYSHPERLVVKAYEER